MSSKSETGHEIDIKNSEKTLEIIAGMGGTYQPPLAEIELAALTPQVAAAKAAQEAVVVALKNWSAASDKQENAFAGLSALSATVNNTVDLLRIPQNRKEEVKGIHLKLTGKRVKKVETAEEGKEAPKTASVSQMSFASRAKNLKELIETLKQIPEYQPKEAELKISALEALAANLETAAAEVDPLETALANARFARNTLYYTPVTGLIDTMADVKKYLKRLKPTGKHPAYVEMNKLQWTKAPKEWKQVK